MKAEEVKALFLMKNDSKTKQEHWTIEKKKDKSNCYRTLAKANK